MATPTRYASRHVSLTSIVVYKPWPDDATRAEIFGGASSQEFVNGRLSFTASTIPFRDQDLQKIALPHQVGLIANYGKDVLDELQYWRSLARQHGVKVASLNFKVDVGVVYESVMTREVLASGVTRVLNLRRAARDLQLEVLEYVGKRAGIPPENRGMALVATRPDLLVEWVMSDPDTQGIEVFIFPVVDTSAADPETTAMRQVAFVRSGAAISDLFQPGDDADLVLPEWLTTKRSK